MYSITQIKDGKVMGTWTEETIEFAIQSIETLKITGTCSVFSIENSNGTVVEVIRK